MTKISESTEKPINKTTTEPYSGQYTAHVTKVKNKLIGTTLEPGEKVYIMVETLEKEKIETDKKAPFGRWFVGVIKEINPEEKPICIPLNLLKMTKITKAEIDNLKKRLTQN